MYDLENSTIKWPKFQDLILFEDEDLLVINKPAMIATLDEREGKEISILRMAKKHHADAQVCHRLDKETSGILLIAKNPTTYRLVSMAFEHRKVTKIYHAVIEGVRGFDALSVKLPILNRGNRNVTIDRATGKDAETIFNTLKYFKNFTLVECRPITGRMHQIRIHLATQRAAIVGDSLYNGNPVYLSQIKKRGYTLSKGKEEQPIMKRFALHAYQLSLQINDKEYHFEAPYPKDFATLIKQLEKFDA